MSSKAYLEIIKSLKRTYDVFRQDGYDSKSVVTVLDDTERTASQQIRLASKIRDEYAQVVRMEPPEPTSAQSPTTKKPKAQNDPSIMPLPKPTKQPSHQASSVVIADDNDTTTTATPEVSTKLSAAEAAAGILPKHIIAQMQAGIPSAAASASTSSSQPSQPATSPLALTTTATSAGNGVLTAWRPGMVASDINKPQWHAPWKLRRVIVGHLGWVRCISVDTTNEWFATGSADRTIKIWDLASSELKVTLTGHISTVRGVAISPRHPYLFSCGEDKTVKCWDLETNKVIRDYHGHLSGVYAIDLHPTLDLLVTGGRDSSVRVWDMRTRANVHTLTGHTDTVMSVAAQAPDPQVVSGSMDKMVRLWDLAAGKCATTLTHHKKGVRAIAIHQKE